MMNKMVRYISKIILGGVLICATTLAPAYAKTMTLEQTVILALAQSPEIKIVKEQKEQAEFSVDEAQASYYPQVDIFAEGGREYNDPRSGTSSGGGGSNESYDATLSVNQFIFDGFETQEEIKRRKQLIESAGIQGTRIEEQIILSTVQAYTSLLQNQRAIKDATAFLTVMDEIEQKLILMVEAGAESEAKLKFVQARLSFARQNKISIDAALSDARTELEQLIGEYPDFDAVHPSGNYIIIKDLEEYYRLAQQNNKEILVNISDKQALEHQLEGLYGQEYPRLNALVEVNQNHDVGGEISRDRNASAMLQVNYRLFDGFAADASRKRVMSQIREVDLLIDQATRDINQRIKIQHNQITSLKNEWLVLEQEIEANDAVRALNQQQFELGEADILELVESEERLFNSRIRKHQIEFDFTQSIHRLKQEVGLLLKDDFLNPEGE